MSPCDSCAHHTELRGLATVNFLGYVANDVYLNSFRPLRESPICMGQSMGGKLRSRDRGYGDRDVGMVGPAVKWLGERRALLTGLFLAPRLVIYGIAWRPLFLSAISVSSLGRWPAPLPSNDDSAVSASVQEN